MATEHQQADSQDFRRRTVAIALVLIGVAAVLWLAWNLRNLLFMAFISVFVAVAFEPPVHTLAKRGWKRGTATGLVFGAAFVFFLLFAWALAPLFIEQIQEIAAALPSLISGLLTFLEDSFGFDFSEFEIDTVGDDISGYVQSLGTTLVGGLLDIASGIGGFLIFVTTVGVFSFYMVADLPKLQRTVLSLMPEDEQRRSLRIWDIAVENMGGYIYSRLILAALGAIVSWAFLSILGVPFAVSLGIWVGVLSQFIPVVGTYLAAVLPAIVALTLVDSTTALWVVVWFVAYQQLENYVFSPRITARTMEIHPAISIAAIIGGGALMGGIGVILALPMAGIIQEIISETGKRHEVVLDPSESD